MIPQIDNPVFSDAVRGAEWAARNAGYSLLISYRAQEGEAAGALRQLSHAHRVDGLLVASLDSDQKLRKELEGTGVPCVVLNRQVPEAITPWCSTRALQHRQQSSISLRSGIVGLPTLAGARAATMPMSGYRATGSHWKLRELGMIRSWSKPQATRPRGVNAFNAIHSRAHPTAVFAASMISAAGVLRALHQLGTRLPDDMSIISVHDAPVAEILHPPLTTVATPTYDMGRIGVEILVSLLNGETPAPVAPLAPIGLIVRSSTAPPSET